MDNNTRPNDWVAAIFFNPDKDIQDLTNLGITPSTSDIKSKEFYKSQHEIVEFFTDDKGKFNDVEFNNFYNSAVSLYNSEEVNNLSSNLLETFEYDKYDILAPENAKRFDSQPTFIKYANPLRQSRGVSDLYKWGAPTMSEREVAQTQKVFNYDTQTFENYTPNDIGALSYITSPTLVLARWEEDGYHLDDGIQVQHQKGELKYNNEGDPFYETLGNRSAYGKDVLHATDILTVDGSSWNKYDFFDSDGLDKSATGSIFKAIATVAPAFIPYVGQVYTAMGIALELGHLIPSLYKSIRGIATNDNSDDSVAWANEMDGWFSKFDYSTSDYGKSGFFNFENIMGIASSSVNQLKQQRLIGLLPGKLAGNENNLNAIKWGRSLSLSYMATTAATDSYEVFKEAGASDRVAGFAALGTMFAMKSLMDNDYFRDFWYNGTPLARSAERKAIKELSGIIGKNYDLGADMTKKEASKFILKTKEFAEKYFKKINANKVFAGSMNEGIEETVEEFAQDAVKGITSSLHYLGLVDNDRKYDFGFSVEGMFYRYAASFVGGAIGGSVFSMHDVVSNINKKTAKESGEDPWYKQIIYLYRNGRGEELRSELKRLHKKGKLGSTSLSGLNPEIIDGPDGVEIKYNFAKKGESQNDIIYNQVLNLFERIEGILSEENLMYSDEYLSNLQFKSEQDKEQFDSLNKKEKMFVLMPNIMDQLEKESGITSGIFDEWNNLSQDILSTKMQMEEMLKPESNSSKTESEVNTHIESVKKTAKYKELESKLKTLREERDKIASGSKNAYYYGKMMFALNPDLAAIYNGGIGLDNFAKSRFGKLYNDLTDEEKSIITSEYSEYTKLDEKAKLNRAYDIFCNIRNKFSKEINDTANELSEYSKLFAGGETEFTIKRNEIYNELLEIREKINDAKSSGNLQEVPILEDQAIQLNRKLRNYERMVQLQTPRAISKSSNEIISRYQEEGEQYNIDNAVDSYIDWLNFLISNNLYVESDDLDLSRIIKQIVYDMERNSTVWEENLKLRASSLEGLDPTSYLNLIQLRKIAIEKLKSLDLNGYLETVKSIKTNELINRSDDDGNEVYNEEEFDLAIGLINGKSIYDYISEIQSLRKSLKISPIYELLKTIASDINPVLANTVDKLLLDIKKVQMMSSLDEYIIKDKHSLDNLKSLQQAIEIVYSLISFGNDINLEINNFQKDDDQFVVIGDDAIQIAKKEFIAIKNKVDRLIEIAERNNNMKLNEQKDITINMRSKIADILTDDMFKEKIKARFDVDIDDLMSQAGVNKDSWSENNFAEKEKAVVKFEDLFYQAIKSKGLSNEKIVENIISMFDTNSLLRRSVTKMSKYKDDRISDYDKAIYLLSIISLPSSHFYEKFRSIVSSSGFNIAPVFSQEYLSKLSYSFIKNQDLFEAFLTKFGEMSKNMETDPYLKNKPILHRVVSVISGGAGSGKTNGVDRIIYEMIRDEADVIVCAPTENQTNKLGLSIGLDGNKYTKEKLIEMITGKTKLDPADIDEEGDPKEGTGEYYYDIHNKHFVLLNNVKINKNNVFGNKKIHVLFIDEYSLFTEPELLLISKWAAQNNVSIILSGDYKQNNDVTKFLVKGQNGIEYKYGLSGIEDFATIWSPELLSPFRSGNIAKLDNYIEFEAALSYIFNIYFKNPQYDPNELSGELHSYLMQKPITLKYFESENSFGGERIVDSKDIDSYIEKIKSILGDKRDEKGFLIGAVIVTDNPNKYANSGIKTIDPKSVQGDEFEYVIIDKDFRLDKSGERQSVYQKVKDLYTLTQRSTQGTIIVDKGLSDVEIKLENDQSSSNKFVMDQEHINKFKEFRLNSLNVIETSDINIDNDVNANDEDEDNNGDNNGPVDDPHVIKDNDGPEVEDIVNDDQNVDNTDDKENNDIENKNNAPSELGSGGVVNSNIMYDHYDNMVSMFASSNIGGKVGLSDDKIIQLYWYIASYYKYGYYETEDGINRLKSKISPWFMRNRNSLDKLINAIKKSRLVYQPYSHNGVNTSAISCEIIIDGNAFYMPILLGLNAVSEIQPLEGKIKAWNANNKNDSMSSNGKNVHEIYNDSDMSGDVGIDILTNSTRIVGKPKILITPKGFNHNAWSKRNSGRTLMIVTTDSLSNDEDADNYITIRNENGDTLYAIPSPSFRLIGANIHARSAETLYDIIHKKISSDISSALQSWIISSETMTDLLKKIFINNSEFAEKMLSVVLTDSSNSSMLPLTSNKGWEMHVVKKTASGEKNVVYKSYQEIVDAKESFNDVINIKFITQEHASKESTKNYYLSSTTVLYTMLTSPGPDHKLHINKDSVSVFNNAIQQYPQGIKLNDKVLWSNKVVEPTWMVAETSNLGISYSTDIDRIYEPKFYIELNSKEDENNNQEDNVENIQDNEYSEMDLESIVKKKLNDESATVTYISTDTGGAWKNKLISVYSRGDIKLYKVKNCDDTKNLIIDEILDGEFINNVFIIKSIMDLLHYKYSETGDKGILNILLTINDCLNKIINGKEYDFSGYDKNIPEIEYNGEEAGLALSYLSIFADKQCN